MKEQTKKIAIIIVAIIAIILILRFAIAFFTYSYITGSIPSGENSHPELCFVPDYSNKTLEVTDLPDQDKELHWNHISIENSSATLPNGTINLGDKITNCQGEIKIIWKPTRHLIWVYNFEEK